MVLIIVDGRFWSILVDFVDFEQFEAIFLIGIQTTYVDSVDYVDC